MNQDAVDNERVPVVGIRNRGIRALSFQKKIYSL